MSNDIRLAGLETECERLRAENDELHKQIESYKSTQEIVVAFVASSRDEMTKMSQQVAILKAEAETLKPKSFLDTIIDAATALNDARDAWQSDARMLYLRNADLEKRLEAAK